MTARSVLSACLAAAAWTLAAVAPPAGAQASSTAAAGKPAAGSMALVGGMGRKALLAIDGKTAMLAEGEAASGVRLLSFDGAEAKVERGGVATVLRLGAPVTLAGTGGVAGAAAREIVIVAGPGGHFVTSGSIGRRPVQFIVDTGATFVAIGRSDAERLGIDLSNAQRTATMTAGGIVPVLALTLSAVKVGEIEVANVQAVVLPGELPQVLLGNSFLQRFQMRRENDVMRLELRR
jgi:aspartyl protease family protein